MDVARGADVYAFVVHTARRGWREREGEKIVGRRSGAAETRAGLSKMAACCGGAVVAGTYRGRIFSPGEGLH